MSLFKSPFLPPWKGPLPETSGRLEASLIVPVPLESNVAVDPEEAVQYLQILRDLLAELYPRRYEILLVLYGENQHSKVLLLNRLTQATAHRKEFQWIAGFHPGRGSAVREAVLRSRGRKILVASLEYYFSPSFFREALKRLGPGLAFIEANRRHSDSEFIVPVTLLSRVFRRHLWGVTLSRIWSLLFSLDMADTLSGGYVLRRDFALKAFNRISCPVFLYEVELLILAKANQYPIADLPVNFMMSAEKSRFRILGEILEVLKWTWRIYWNFRRGEYFFLKLTGNNLSADDWGLSPAVNDGILKLAKLGHLRWVSVLGGGKYLKYRLAELKRVPGIEFGLHFNLTNPEGGGEFKSPGGFLWAWMKSRWLGRRETVHRVRKALAVQLLTLREAGIRPKRLDGHHHVHAVPGLLGEVVDILKWAGIRYVRVPYHQALWFGRRAAIAFLGLNIHQAVKHYKFVTAPFYYPSQGDFTSFNRLVNRLNRTHKAEVLIHPASRNDIAQAAPSDTYREERVREYDLLRLLAIELKNKK